MRKSVTISIIGILVLMLAPTAIAVDRISADRPGNCEIVGADGMPADVPTLACLGQAISNVINVAFLFLGFVGLAFILLGSIKLILSRGDQKALQSAKGTVTYAIIGTVFLALAYVIVNIAFSALGYPTILQNFTFYQG